MKFPIPLEEGILLKRYKRFLSDIQLSDGRIVQAHCTNTGSMKGVLNPPQRAWILDSGNPKRKLPYTLYILENEEALVGVHTHFANTLVYEALTTQQIPELAHLTDIRREVKLPSGSRLDFCGTTPEGKLHFIEVKHVSLAEGSHGFFPDSVTERGTKHIRELQALKRAGEDVTLLFVSQRSDLALFSPAATIDPVYTQALVEAVSEGVQVLVYGSIITPEEIRIAYPIPLQLPS